MTSRPMTEWKPSDGDTVCQECGASNPVWFTDDHLWNQVMPNDGVLCPRCFIARTEPMIGGRTIWRIAPTVVTVDAPPPLKRRRFRRVVR